MNLLRFSLAVILTAFAGMAAAAQSKPYVPPTPFDLATVPEVKLAFDKIDPIPIDTVEVSIPAMMVPLSGNRLAVLDEANEWQIKVVSLETGKVDLCLRHGNAPDEMSVVNNIINFGGFTWLTGADGKIGMLYDSPYGFPDVKVVKALNYRPLTMVPVGPNAVVTLPIHKKIRFLRTNITDGKSDTCRSFPFRAPLLRNSVCHAQLGISPDGRNLVAVNGSWGIIEILDPTTLERRHNIGSPIPVESKVEAMNLGDLNGKAAYSLSQRPMYNVYQDLVMADDGFYVGFVGKMVEDKAVAPGYLQMIVKFDYDGNPVCRISLPPEVRSFTVDDSGRLYMATRDGEILKITATVIPTTLPTIPDL